MTQTPGTDRPTPHPPPPVSPHGPAHVGMHRPGRVPSPARDAAFRRERNRRGALEIAAGLVTAVISTHRGAQGWVPTDLEESTIALAGPFFEWLEQSPDEEGAS